MPRSSYPAAATAEFKKRNGWIPTVLVDIQTRDGTTYYLADFPGTYPVKIGSGPTAVYSPWVISAGPFNLSKKLQTDAGDLVLQNLSGNTIDRDVAAAMLAHEFEGALCIIRFWHELLAVATREFHGTLGDQHDAGDSASFRFQQLFETQMREMPDDPFASQCIWQFKEGRCGSTGVATSCPKDFASCADVSRAATERFTGMPIVPPKLEYYKAEEVNPAYTRATGVKLDQVNVDQIVTYSDRSNPQLGGYRPIAYGKSRGAGFAALTHTRVPATGMTEIILFQMLGEGEWDGIDSLWISNLRRNPADTTQFHFHAGADGTLGGGLAATSTGPDQGVDSFFALMPGAIQRITFSRIAYLVAKVTQSSRDIQAVPEVKGDYRTRKCRIFDAAGNQTAFQYTSTPTWEIIDLLVRYLIKRQATSGQVLSATEKTRIDFVSADAHATDCDFNIGGGIKRFEGHLTITKKTTVAQVLEQMLQLSQSYITEDAGAIVIKMDKTRASTFTLTTDHLVGRVEVLKTNKRKAPNRFIGHFRDLNAAKVADIDTLANSGAVRNTNVVTIKTTTDHLAKVGDYYIVQGVSVGANSFNGTFPITVVVDSTHFKYAQAGANETQGGGTVARDESRFMDDVKIVDHEEHQNMAGQRGLGLSTVPTVIPVDLDFGNNTSERVERLLRFIAVRNLGVGLINGDLAGAAYKIPREVQLKAWMHSVDAANNALDAQAPGERITIDKSCSEEYAGDYELLEIGIPRIAAGQREEPVLQLHLLEWVDAAFSDAVGPQPVKVGSYPADSGLLGAIGDDGRYAVDAYHDSAGRVGNNNDRFGSTSAAVFTTVATYTLHLPPRVTFYAGQLQCNNVDGSSFIKGAGSGATSGGVGTAWTNPGNITAEDGTLAVATNIPDASNSQDLIASGFGFAIPSYHTILGISVRVKKSGSGAGLTDLTTKLRKAGVAVGTNKASATAWAALANFTYGTGTTDLWGAAWTPADINAANFGFQISAQNNSGGAARTASGDYVEVTVYTDAGAISGKARLKIGAQTSSETTLTSPATTAVSTVSISGLTPNSDVTVEIQAEITSAAGSVEGRFTQIQYTDQDYTHFKPGAFS
jgi:hypothetical protein